jgi:HEAT repeat protein
VGAIVLPAAPPKLQAPAARAIGAMKEARGLEVLERLLGADPPLEALVVTQATRLLPLASPAQAEPFLEPLRDHLLDGDDSLARSAALALGRLEDPGAIPNLAQLLDDENGRPCREAHWALCRIAGLTLPPERAAWEGWYQEERRWFQEEAPVLFEHLRSADPTTLVDAVRQLSRHRLHREAIAEFLAKGLGHEDPQVRLVIVSGLLQLGGSTARAALEDARGDADETVRLRAAAALESLQRG